MDGSPSPTAAPTVARDDSASVDGVATPRFAYLGPQGTFTEMALRSWRPAVGADHVPMGSVDAALAALRAGEVDAAMVPIENSVEGGVSATLDALANGEPLVVVGEVLVPITFVLAAPAGTPLASIRSVGTHPHAWAQVRGWMAQQLPDAVYVPTLTTAAIAVAVVLVAQVPLLPLPDDVMPSRSLVLVSLGAAAALMYAITLACAAYPSRIAARVEPADALRYE